MKHELEAQTEGERLDVFIARTVPELSRSRIKTLILDGNVRVNQKPVKPHYKVHLADSIEVEADEVRVSEHAAEAIPLDILYEDEALIVVDKPAGIVVHPGAGNPDHTLVNALLHHAKQNLSGVGEAFRPGIVHRLDKDTSGVMVVAKNDRVHESLQKQFSDRTVNKQYQAIVKGVVDHEEFKCDEPIGKAVLSRKKLRIQPVGGRESLTYFRVVERFNQATRLEVRPRTGRTHQIRVHLTHLGHPILGDYIYGNPFPLIDRHALHAERIEFMHPLTNERVSFTSPLPEDMLRLIVALKS